MAQGSLQSVIGQLEEIFKVCNNRFFDGKVQQPIIAVNSDSSNSCYGWLTTWKAWQEEGTEGYYEINICAESLNRSVNDIIATMLHEMTHLWNLQNGVKDTSRGNSYHNKKFKVEAEQRGLSIEQHEKYGWTLTELNQEGLEFAEKFSNLVFSLYRTPMAVAESTTVKKKSSSRKYICPCCEQSIRATKEIKVLCGECSTEDNLVLMECEDEE